MLGPLLPGLLPEGLDRGLPALLPPLWVLQKDFTCCRALRSPVDTPACAASCAARASPAAATVTAVEPGSLGWPLPGLASPMLPLALPVAERKMEECWPVGLGWLLVLPVWRWRAAAASILHRDIHGSTFNLR
jgi:hypothetical protein